MSKPKKTKVDYKKVKTQPIEIDPLIPDHNLPFHEYMEQLRKYQLTSGDIDYGKILDLSYIQDNNGRLISQQEALAMRGILQSTIPIQQPKGIIHGGSI
jgi:hypothetical protein